MFVVVYWSTNLYTKVPLSIAEKLNINLRLFMERRVVNITQRSKGSEASHTVTRGLPVSLEQFQSAASFARVQSESLKSACGALSALGSWRAAGEGRAATEVLLWSGVSDTAGVCEDAYPRRSRPTLCVTAADGCRSLTHAVPAALPCLTI